MNQKELVLFKIEDSLWRSMAKGNKYWDAQPHDLTDERIVRLAKGHWVYHCLPGGRSSYEMDEDFVCFENESTSQILQFRFKGLRYAGWAQGWCFIVLGELVGGYDQDGGEFTNRKIV